MTRWESERQPDPGGAVRTLALGGLTQDDMVSVLTYLGQVSGRTQHVWKVAPRGTPEVDLLLLGLGLSPQDPRLPKARWVVPVVDDPQAVPRRSDGRKRTSLVRPFPFIAFLAVLLAADASAVAAARSSRAAAAAPEPTPAPEPVASPQPVAAMVAAPTPASSTTPRP
ncbi:hypothetical protein G3A44_22555, partial [Ideonella sp. TBM-1]|nr:hypothetical protein [Ideonella livida]